MKRGVAALLFAAVLLPVDLSAEHIVVGSRYRPRLHRTTRTLHYTNPLSHHFTPYRFPYAGGALASPYHYYPPVGCPPYLAPVRPYGIYGLITGSPRGELVRANTSDLVLAVTPARALVYIDGLLIGSAGDFSTPRERYPLVEGRHRLRMELTGYKPFEADLEVTANRVLHLEIELEPAGP